MGSLEFQAFQSHDVSTKRLKLWGKYVLRYVHVFFGTESLKGSLIFKENNDS